MFKFLLKQRSGFYELMELLLIRMVSAPYLVPAEWVVFVAGCSPAVVLVAAVLPVRATSAESTHKKTK